MVRRLGTSPLPSPLPAEGVSTPAWDPLALLPPQLQSRLSTHDREVILASVRDLQTRVAQAHLDYVPVFGYASLMTDNYKELGKSCQGDVREEQDVITGTLKDYAMGMVLSTVYYGTPEHPGTGAGIAPAKGSQLKGTVLKVPLDRAEELLAVVIAREFFAEGDLREVKDASGRTLSPSMYKPAVLPVDTAEGSVPALVFVRNDESPKSPVNLFPEGARPPHVMDGYDLTPQQAAWFLRGRGLSEQTLPGGEKRVRGSPALTYWQNTATARAQSGQELDPRFLSAMWLSNAAPSDAQIAELADRATHGDTHALQILDELAELFQGALSPLATRAQQAPSMEGVKRLPTAPLTWTQSQMLMASQSRMALSELLFSTSPRFAASRGSADRDQAAHALPVLFKGLLEQARKHGQVKGEQALVFAMASINRALNWPLMAERVERTLRDTPRDTPREQFQRLPLEEVDQTHLIPMAIPPGTVVWLDLDPTHGGPGILCPAEDDQHVCKLPLFGNESRVGGHGALDPPMVHSLPFLPDSPLIAADSDRGLEMLARARLNVGVLANYRPQPQVTLCGPTTGRIVLDAMGKEGTFFTEAVKRVKDPMAIAGADATEPGVSLEQLATMLQAHGVHVRTVHAHQGLAGVAQFKQDVVEAFAQDRFVTVNFHRRDLKQGEGSGHHSPIAGYVQEGQDLYLLVAEVSNHKYPFFWVRAEDLYTGMCGVDAGETRGYLVLSVPVDSRTGG